MGEGPAWDHRNNTLYWVDIQRGHLQAYDYASGENSIYPMGEFVGAAVPTTDGRLIVALQNRLGIFDVETRQLDIVCTPEPGQISNRFNDGKCDPAGRFWIGSTQINHQDPTGKLYCVAPSFAFSSKLDDLLISNGLAWSLDHKTMYFIDSPTHKVGEFDYDETSGEIEFRRNALSFDQRQGTPDGMCIDSEGMLWIAFYGGGKVACYDPGSGRCLKEIPVPARNTTSCCFGGPDLDVLFITTAKRDDPQGGGLYCCSPGVGGLPTNFFGKP